MSEKAVAKAVGIKLCAHTALDVVVYLEVTYAVIADKTINNARCKVANLGISEIELIATVVDNSLSVSHKETIVGPNLCKRTVDAHNLDLEPNSGNHAL